MTTSRRTWIAAASTMLVAGGARAARAQTATVRIATTAAESYAQPFYAQEAGLFAKHGVNVEIGLLATGAAVGTAVAGGAADVGVLSTITLGNAIVRGVPLVAIAPCALTTARAPISLLVVGKSSTARTPKDFEGTTIAVPSLRQAADLALRVWLAAGGADVAKVRIVESSFAEMGAGIERGLFAGATISDPALTNALKKNDVKRFADIFAAISPEHMVAAWFTTQQYLQSNPDGVKRVAAALTDSAKWANTHHNETALIVSKLTKVDLDVIKSESRPIYGEVLRASDLQPQLDAAFKAGWLSRAVNAGEFIIR
jgi:NitT/TauT family transport system substrate-binding protein